MSCLISIPEPGTLILDELGIEDELFGGDVTVDADGGGAGAVGWLGKSP